MKQIGHPDRGFSCSIVKYRQVLVSGRPCFRVTRYYSIRIGAERWKRVVRQIGLISYADGQGWHYTQVFWEPWDTSLSALASSQVASKLERLKAKEA